MWMSNVEVDFFKNHLNNNQRVLEWGCGSSTIDISKIVKEVHSIEHNKDWYDNINSKISNTNVNLYLCEPDNEYVEGGHCGTFQQFETYIKKTLELGKFDLIFIDGCHEFRYAMTDLMNCRQLAHKDTIVALDDTSYRLQIAQWNEGPTLAWVLMGINNIIEALSSADYLPGRGMSWGKYIL